MAADKGKKTRVEEGAAEDEGELVQSVEKLQEIQDELEKINEEASDKVLEVEQKYNEIRRPVYLKRNKIIQSIPDFWLTAFLSHPFLGELLTEEDQKVFKYMTSIDVEDFKEMKSGFSISFNFATNPYFEDTKLTKVFSFSDDGVSNPTSTIIKWKDGMNISNGVASEKKGKKRPFVEQSFFSWFGETQEKGISDLHDEIAEMIKDDLWPNPLKYFNNDADEEEFEDDDDDEERASDEDDDDDNEDGEQDDADEDEDA